MSDSRTSNAIKNSGAGIINKFVHILCKFILRTVFLKLLGDEYTGISGLFTDILGVLNLMELGLDVSVVYALYSPVAHNDQRKISALLNFYKKAFTYIGVGIICAGVLCIPFLDYIVKDVPNIKEDIRVIFLMYLLTSASSYFLIYRTMLLKAKQRSRIVSKVQLITEAVVSVISVVLLLLFREFFLYLVVNLVATWGKNIYLFRLVTKMYPESFEKNDAVLMPEEKKKLIRDIACLTVYTMSGVVINSTDSIFISAFVGTAEVALVGNFTLLIRSVKSIAEHINASLKASVGNLAATENSEKQELVFNKILFIFFWAVCVTTTCLFALLNPFVGDIWLGQAYKIPISILAVLVVNYFISIMVLPVESFRTSNGLFVQGWMRPAIMAVLNIALDFLMGIKWGIFGIFLATTISRLVTQVWFDPYLIYREVFRKSSFPFFKKYVVYACVTAISCIVTAFAVSCIEIPINIICFFVKAIIAVIVPNVLIVVLFHRCKEFSYVGSFFKRIKRKFH